MVLEYSEICAILPQAHPMVLVDRIVALEPDVSIVGIKAVSGSEPCYRHIPPGVEPARCAYPVSLLLESFGQTAAILWLSTASQLREDPELVLMFAGARDSRIERSVFPGDVLEHRIRLVNIVGNNVFVEGETWAGEARVAMVGSMVAVARPRSAVRQSAGGGAPLTMATANQNSLEVDCESETG